MNLYILPARTPLGVRADLQGDADAVQTRAERGWGAAAVVLGHGALVWALVQPSAIQVVQPPQREVAPLVAEFLLAPASPVPSTAAAIEPLRHDAPRPRVPAPRAVVPAPDVPSVLAAAADAPSPAFTAPAPAPDVAPTVTGAPPASHAAAAADPRAVSAAAPTVALPAAPRVLPSTAVAYRVLPAVEVPAAARRAGEQGTVWLRVHVGRDGLPAQITLHRSSGHARLDEQALSAMRQARFEPQTQHGEPIEWIVIAPLQYELE